jgi:hypothetical protein
MAKCPNAKKKSRNQTKNGTTDQRKTQKDFDANITSAPKATVLQSGTKPKDERSHRSLKSITAISVVD